MKKLFVTVLSFTLASFLLSSCAPGGTAPKNDIGEAVAQVKAGDIFIEIPVVDDLVLNDMEYEVNTAFATDLHSKISAARLDGNEIVPSDAKSTLTFRGVEHSVRFGRYSKPYMRRAGYDTYYSNVDNTVFRVDRASGKLIGYMLPLDATAHRSAVAVDRDRLIATARTALGEFMDASYYSQVDVQHDSLDYSVEFYNTVCGAKIADSSTVQLCDDGTVISVIAQADPEMKAAVSGCSFNTDEYNGMLDQKLAQAYPAFSCNDEKKLAEVEYIGMEIRSCLASLDDAGRPILMYHIAPQLSYDITYRGEWASSMTSRGEDVHQTGVYQPPVYAAVYLTDQ